jgi:hypothetical protein
MYISQNVKMTQIRHGEQPSEPCQQRSVFNITAEMGDWESLWMVSPLLYSAQIWHKGVGGFKGPLAPSPTIVDITGVQHTLYKLHSLTL